MGALADSAPYLLVESDTLALTDGASVPSWTNNGSNGGAFAQATGASQPTYQAGETPTGLGAVLFDGTNDIMSKTGTLTGSTRQTLMAVVKVASSATSRAIFGTGASVGLGLRVNTAGKVEIRQANSTVWLTGATVLPNTDFVLITATLELSLETVSTAGSTTPDLAFNGSTTDGWGGSATPTVGAPQYVGAKLPSGAAVVTSVDITNATAATGPKDFKIEGSHDASTWDTLDTRIGVVWASSVQVQNFSFSNSIAYEYYRVITTAAQSGGGVAIREIDFGGATLPRNSAIRINGTVDASTATIPSGSPGENGTTTIGGQNTTTSAPFNGLIAMLARWNRLVPSAELAAIETEVAAKYLGAPSTTLSLPVTRPLAFVTEVPATTLGLPVTAPLSFSPATTLGLPVTAPLSFDPATELKLGVNAGLDFSPATAFDLPVQTGLEFAANQPGQTELSLPVIVPLSFAIVEETATTTVHLENPARIRTVAGSLAHLRNPTVIKVEAPIAVYDSPPSYRMLWDVDGTRMRKYAMPAWSEYDSFAIVDLNDETASTGVSDTVTSATSYVIYFPEKRDLKAIFASFALANPADDVFVTAQTSPDTTNGLNGTWTTRVAATPVSSGPWGASPVDFRSPVSVEANGIRAVRLAMSAEVPSSGWTLRSLHFYGELSVGANPHRLALWHPTEDRRVGPDYFNWGKSPRGSSADRQFRIKNLSPTQRANSIEVYCDALTDAFPSIAYQHYFSLGRAFANSLTLGAIEAGRISPVITLRRVTPSDAEMGVWAPRVRAVVGGWF